MIDFFELFDHSTVRDVVATLVLRREADVLVRDSRLEMQFLDGHICAYEGIVIEYE